MDHVLTAYQYLNNWIEEKGQAALVTKWSGKSGQNCEVKKAVCQNTEGMRLPLWEESDDGIRLTEYFSKKERLILFGGGHVSLALAEFAAKTGFLVTLVDDRPFFANSSRFSCASKVICDDFAHAITQLNISSLDYVVILTRGHRFDQVCIEALNKQPLPYYLGMLGSKRRVAQLKKVLLDEGINEQLIEMLNAPVGLDIGAVTPGEIAISIMAQLVEYRRKDKTTNCFKKSDIDVGILDVMAKLPYGKDNIPCAIVTVLMTKGSTPRKAGAKMIIYSDGHIEGTIGGGCAEAAVIQEARSLLGRNTYKLYQVDMTGNAWEEETMLCGGFMQVFIESFAGKE